MYIGLHAKYSFFLPDFDKTLISRQIFEKYSNINLRENELSGSRDVPRGRADRHEEAKSRVSQLCESA